MESDGRIGGLDEGLGEMPAGDGRMERQDRNRGIEKQILIAFARAILGFMSSNALGQ